MRETPTHPHTAHKTAGAQSLRLALVATALALSAAACLVAQVSPIAALLAFVVAGGILASQTRADSGQAWPAPSQSGTRLEYCFVALLILFSLAIRLYRLDLYPAGAGFVESIMSLLAGALKNAPYTPHCVDSQADFPTLVFYQGLGAAEWLGWKLQVFRLPAALWGTLSVAAIYFFLRQISSVFTAGIFALLFSVNNLNLVLSRLFFPGSLLFFSVAATAAFLMMALKRRHRLLFLCAGLCCGLGLHGYVPGRIELPLFGAWLAGLCAAGRAGKLENAPRIGDLLLFLGAALAAASPVLLWAWRNPAVYNGITHQNLVGRTAFDLVKAYCTELPKYLEVFHVIPDASVANITDGLPIYPVLHADWIAQAAFPLGMVLCLAAFWRPLPSLVLAGFFLGLAPGALGTTVAHPSTRRALLALPWVYAAGALTFERARSSLKAPLVPEALRKGLGIAAALACCAVLAVSLRQYFVDIMGNPEVRSNFNVAGSLVGQEMARFPGDDVKIGYFLAEPGSCLLSYNRDQRYRMMDSFPDFLVLPGLKDGSATAIKQFEDYLLFRGDKPELLLLPPTYLQTLPLLKTLFPRGQAKVFSEQTELGEGQAVWDAYEPLTELLRFEIPLADIAAFKGMVDLDLSAYAPGSRVGTQAPGFSLAHQGRALRLGAVAVVPEEGAQVRFELAWRGWALRVDGRTRPWGRDFPLDPGAHRIEIQGRVPRGAQGPLPMKILQGTVDWIGQNMVLPVDPRQGWTDTLAPLGRRGPGVRRFELVPLHVFDPPEGVEPPFASTLDSLLRVPRAGAYRFRVRLPFRGRILVDSKPVFDDTSGTTTLDESVALAPEKAAALRVESKVVWDSFGTYTLMVDISPPGTGVWGPLPLEWLSPGDAKESR